MKPTSLFTCSNCDAQTAKWTGRCLECGKWGTMAEVAATMPTASGGATRPTANALKVQNLKDIVAQTDTRHLTGLKELDRVLGGGLVPGSLILLGGEPGIGKSTLALQLATSVPKTLYVSAEESVEQIKLRTERMQLKAPTLELVSNNQLEAIIATIIERKPPLTILDSIQTIAADDGESGSASHIRTVSARLLEVAKTYNVSIVIIGHVTKEGAIAGPKTLEHLVDTVMYLEGDRHHFYRILRTTKNRFGATDEIGVFEMRENGLQEVPNPSANFLAERTENPPGNVITCLIEGSRAVLVEIQALVNKTAFGYPTRKASGFDINRLHVIIAILQKRAGLSLGEYDVLLNVVGGLSADEPAADLAVAIAIASAYKDQSLGADLAVFGEVGLGGEVRSISQTEKRIKECEQLGLKRIILPKNTTTKKTDKIKIISVTNIKEIIK